MYFHSLQFKIQGSVEGFFSANGQDLDIADQFSHLSQSLGFEGNSGIYAGLWATQFVYNDYSLLEGDFLARGLHLDLLCDSDYPIPFSAIFLCLGETLKRTASCIVTEVTVSCEPYSVKANIPKGKSRSTLEKLSESKIINHALPVTQVSRIRYSCKGKRNTLLASGAIPFPMTRCYLPELALPFSAIYSQWGKRMLKHAETIQIAAN